jgi:large subunit ribosomal protein L21
MDYAVIQTGSKQYCVSPGKVLLVEKLDGAEQGSHVVFKDVRLVRRGDEVLVGSPRVESAQVRGEVLEQTRGRKIVVFKKRRRKGYNKKQGHRQSLTRVRIDRIEIG